MVVVMSMEHLKVSFFKIIALLLLLLFFACSSGIRTTHSELDLALKSDSLISLNPDDTDLLNSIINAKISLAKTKGGISIYEEILILDPTNKIAQYHIKMNEGYQYHDKDYKNGQWDAIQAFSKAAALIDTLGEPHYWIGKAYEKKDEMDFELPLESYNKSLTLFLPPDMKEKVEMSKRDLLKRKKTYDDFWR